MIVYKYRGINDFTFDLLSKNEFHLSLPKDFNDPFDCFIRRDNNITKDEWLEYIDNEPYSTPQQKAKFKKELEENNFEIEKLRRGYNSFYRDESLYVCCFSKVNNSILLWSHYANCHRGIALGFETINIDEIEYLKFDEKVNVIKGKEYLGDLYEVKYGKIPEAYNFIKSQKTNTSPVNFFYTKSPKWDYEEEYRLIFYADILKKQKIKFSKTILKEIIFGLDIASHEEFKIIEYVNKHYLSQGFDVKFYKCVRKEGEYDVNIVDLNFN